MWVCAFSLIIHAELCWLTRRHFSEFFKSQPWIEAIRVRSPHLHKHSFHQNLCLYPTPYDSGSEGESENGFLLVFEFLHLFINMQGVSCEWGLLHAWMAEVSAPDEYQAHLVLHSDHHLPRVAPDSPSAAQTLQNASQRTNFINIFNKSCSNSKG